MGTPLFRREKFVDVIDEAEPLLRAHWHEIARFPDIPLDIDQRTYMLAEAAGMLRIFTARVERRADVAADRAVRHLDLVGYAVYIVSVHPHYKGSLQAKQDVVYVEQASRGRWIGYKLLKYADAELTAEGIEVAHQHQKIAHPALGVILKRLGYEPAEVIWTKRLNNCEGRSGMSSGGEQGEALPADFDDELAEEPADGR